MKVILRQDFETLGKIGEVVAVKDGYARNYLIPRSIAYRATTSSLRALEEEKKQHDRQEQSNLRMRKNSALSSKNSPSQFR